MIRRTELHSFTALKRSPIARSAPVKSKRSKSRRGRLIDAAYREWVRTLPCVICYLPLYENGLIFECLLSGMGFPFRAGHTQTCPSECAHVGQLGLNSSKGMSVKCSDLDTLPLCATVHHQEGKESIHKLPRTFWAHHGADRDALLAGCQATYQALRKAA